jgi:OmpA-OmpF porin, OOP family
MNKAVMGLIIASITTPAFADSGFYAELALGNADNKSSINVYENGEQDESFSISKSSNSYGIRAGYQIGQNFAVELGLQENGSIKYTEVDEFGTYSDKIGTSSTNIGIKGILPVGETFSLYARLGVAQWDLDSNSTDPEFPEEDLAFSKSGNDVYYSIGGDFVISEKFNIGVEYSTVTMGWSDSFEFFGETFRTDIDHEVNNLSITMTFKF